MFVLSKEIVFNGDFYTQIKGFEENRPHSHEFIEFLMITSGSIEHSLNGQKSVLAVGDVVLIMPGSVHQFVKLHGEESFFHRDILFETDYFKKVCDLYSPHLFDDFSQNKHQPQFKLSPEQFSQIENYISTLILDRKNETHNMIVHSLCTYFINILLSQYLQLSSHPQWIASLLSVLSNPVNLAYPLANLTRDVNFTHSYMCRDFKKHVGMTMTEYFNNQKMYYAHTLLTTSSLSIEKICELIGINNVSHFYKLYKKVYGFTPKKARMYYLTNSEPSKSKNTKNG